MMKATLYGLLAEFRDPDSLVNAVWRTREAGYRRMDAFSPYPIEELTEAMKFTGVSIPLTMLIGGIVGAVVGFGLQLYATGSTFPLNLGGHPINSWPLFVPVIFEMTVLFAVLAGAIGMFVLNGLPMPYHPAFNFSRFADMTKDGFLMIIEAADPKFNYEATRAFLQSLNPREVYDVAA
jgi:hypothetical protein